MQTFQHPAGEYSFAAGIAPYSAGVVAMDGFDIVHVTLRAPLPYQAGFKRIETYLAERNRPRHALCAVELRLPAPLSFAGFAEFNAEYGQRLADWNLLVDGRNPVARTNVAPAFDAPGEPVLHGFSYTTPRATPLTGLLSEPGSLASGPPSFIVAGAGDLRDQAALDSDHVVRPCETSPEAMHEKATCVLDVMEARMAALGVGWSEVTTVNIYTKEELGTVWTETICPRLGPAVSRGLHWTLSAPPIIALAFEMDLRGVRHEVWL